MVTDDCYNRTSELTEDIIRDNNNMNLINESITTDKSFYENESLYTSQMTEIKTEEYCEIICSKETPFLIIDQKICVNKCNINDINNNNCILFNSHIFLEADLKLNEIIKNIRNNNFKEGFVYKTKEAMFSITKIDINNYNIFKDCENSINISYSDNLNPF